MTVSQSPLAGARHARRVGLHYGYDHAPGITRRRRGRRFEYFDRRGRRILSEPIVTRCRKLAVPPAWTKVWISPRPNSHLQATGIDARGRKQYRYHPDWRIIRDRTKFQNLCALGTLLTGIRARVLAELRRDELDHSRVVAAIVRLLDRTGLRIGNDRYLQENHTSGLATISKQHATLHRGREIELDFPGKGGKVWHGTVLAPRVARVIAQCQGIPGYRLFKYKDARGKAREVGSADINQWLHEVTGNPELTAKDFRTWHACILFIEAAIKRSGAKAVPLKELLSEVSAQLGNTPTILKKSYIHPNLIDLWQSGRFAAPDWRRISAGQCPRFFSRTEALFLRWLTKKYPSSA